MGWQVLRRPVLCFHARNPAETALPTNLQKRIDDQPSISREMIREAQQILHRHLKSVGLKHTQQRYTILRTFLQTRDHRSTYDLFQPDRKQEPKIGFTTAYR